MDLASIAKDDSLIKKRLAKFDDVYKAEDFLRSLPTSLERKRAILNTDTHLKELQDEKNDYSSSLHLKKVKKLKSSQSYHKNFTKQLFKAVQCVS
jgi:hypothetical protein